MSTDLAPLRAALHDTGPAGVFLRFVLGHTGRADLFDLRPGAVIGSGQPAKVYVADAHWLFASDREAAEVLFAAALDAPGTRAAYWMAPGRPAAPPGWQVGTDLILVASPAPDEAFGSLLTGDELLASLDRLHPDLRRHVPPPPILAQLPFRFHGLVRDGRIVALCDTTVDDGATVAVAQVHTAPDLRGRGLATELVRGVLAQLHELGRAAAVWLCDRENAASVALARRCGFRLLHEVPRLARSGA